MGVCFWLDSSMRVHTSVRRSVLQPMSRIRVLGQKSWISAFHCKNRNRLRLLYLYPHLEPHTDSLQNIIITKLHFSVSTVQCCYDLFIWAVAAGIELVLPLFLICEKWVCGRIVMEDATISKRIKLSSKIRVLSASHADVCFHTSTHCFQTSAVSSALLESFTNAPIKVACVDATTLCDPTIHVQSILLGCSTTSVASRNKAQFPVFAFWAEKGVDFQ